MIVIVDYGVGNARSIANMLRRTGFPSVISNEAAKIEEASKLILPGVGSFDTAMQELLKTGLIPVIEKKVFEEKIPVLGICLGMQLLTNGSEEGKTKGLGWIPAFAYKFDTSSGLKVPHMRWNDVRPSQSSRLTKDMDEATRFYFVHSYYVQTETAEHSILKTDYGIAFDSAIQKENIYGVQFHPEKSHKYGMKLLSNFANI